MAVIRDKTGEVLKALAKTRGIGSEGDRVCWHCTSVDDFENSDASDFYEVAEEAILSVIPAGVMEPVAFGHFEFWESVYPTQDWIELRLSQFEKLGSAANIVLEAWSFEPVDRSFGWIPQAWGYEDEDEGARA